MATGSLNTITTPGIQTLWGMTLSWGCLRTARVGSGPAGSLLAASIQIRRHLLVTVFLPKCGPRSLQSLRTPGLCLGALHRWATLSLRPGHETLRVFDPAPNSDRAGTTVARSDAAGILWLGAGHGLLRFDPATGNSIRYPRGSPSSKRSAAAIVGMEFDKSGKLWLLTADGALSVFDPITRTFVGGWAVRAPISNGAYSFGVDPSGIVWLGGGTDSNSSIPVTERFGPLRNDPADGSSLSGNEVWSIARDREGNTWFGVKGGGVNRLSVRSTRFGAWRHDPADPDSLGDSNVRAIAGDTTGTIWLGTYTRGLDRFEPKSGKFVHYRHDPGIREALTLIPSTLSTPTGWERYGQRATVPLTDLTGRAEPLSISCATAYSMKHHGSGARSTTCTKIARGASGSAGRCRQRYSTKTRAQLPSCGRHGGVSMFEDRNANLWWSSGRSFGSNLSLEKMEPGGKLHTVVISPSFGARGPEPVQVNFFSEDSEGILWLGTETGLVRLDPRTEKIQHLHHSRGIAGQRHPVHSSRSVR